MTSIPTPSPQSQGELIRRVLAVLVVLMLAAVSLWILAPFLTALVWAGTITVATWPALIGLQRRLGGSRGGATAVMTLIMLLVLFVPVLVIVASIIDHAGEAAHWATQVAATGLPPAPMWMKDLPVVGPNLVTKWDSFAALDGEQLVVAVTPWLRQASAWLVGKAGGLLFLSLQFLLTALVTAILFYNGERAAFMVVAVARKLDPVRGTELTVLAARSVRGVALGVVVTALIQTLLSALVLTLTRVPGAMLLTGLILVLCLAQLGPLIPLAASVAWLYWSGHSGPGTVLLVCSLVIVTLDNVLRPVLIKRGANLPLLLVFSGVIGGMLALGILGIFVGPVVLAVTFTLLQAWVRVPDEGVEVGVGAGREEVATGPLGVVSRG
jgi:predicted PurR-regulated permease PerM